MNPAIRHSHAEILICGFGGQGVIFAGELLGRAAVLAGLAAAESASYGSEARGSACHAGVVISSSPIAYPKVRRPDILIALSQDSYAKFLPSVKSGGRVFFDGDLIKRQARDGIDQTGIPASSEAARLGGRGAANVFLLAAAIAIIGRAGQGSDGGTDIPVCHYLPSRAALEQAITQQSATAYRDLNLKALEAGWGLKG